MKSTPTNDYRLSAQTTVESDPPLSKQEKDMFVMKAITLMAKEKISRESIKKTPIRVIEQSKENVCCMEMVVSLPNKIMTLKGQFKRLSSKHSLPVKGSFHLSSSQS